MFRVPQRAYAVPAVASEASSDDSDVILIPPLLKQKLHFPGTHGLAFI